MWSRKITDGKSQQHLLPSCWVSVYLKLTQDPHSRNRGAGSPSPPAKKYFTASERKEATESGRPKHGGRLRVPLVRTKTWAQLALICLICHSSQNVWWVILSWLDQPLPLPNTYNDHWSDGMSLCHTSEPIYYKSRHFRAGASPIHNDFVNWNNSWIRLIPWWYPLIMTLVTVNKSSDGATWW